MTSVEAQLSVVVVTVGGVRSLRRCLRELLMQSANDIPDLEIIVPYYSRDFVADALIAEFPSIRFLAVVESAPDLGSSIVRTKHEQYDLLKTRGIDACQAPVVALIEDTVVPTAGWSRKVLAAHRESYTVVGGAVEHDGEQNSNWAAYLMDFGRYARPSQRERTSRRGKAFQLTDINVSYKMSLLNRHQDLWHPRYNEVELHWGLMNRGETLWFDPDIVVRQDRGFLPVRQLMSERFQWGWVYGRKRAQGTNYSLLVALIVFGPAIPLVRLVRLAAHLVRSRRHRLRFVVALPCLVPLTLAWSLGEFLGYLSFLRYKMNRGIEHRNTR